jgi:integrase
VPEIGRSVFVIPAEAVKTKRPHVVILNDAAWSIIQTLRGQHSVWVFTYRGRPVRTMNNNGWQQARREVGLPLVRVHDLRHNSEHGIIPRTAASTAAPSEARG